jgi:DNA-3-methyladenine glycosylase I
VTEVSEAVVLGEDGRSRCVWSAKDEEYRRYHDEEWGAPLHGDRALFEKLSLEGFQAGLSWITILRRRDRFRAVFHDFDIDRVAQMGPNDV